MFEYRHTVKLHETDAAGVLFFANQFRIAHDAYEAFLDHIGLPIASFFRDRGYYLPIVHTEADYAAPLFVGTKVIIRVVVKEIGNSSFTMQFDFQTEKGKPAGSVQTVHVSIDATSKVKIALPDDLRTALTGYQDQS
jgi:1,4-dihydroxy-2-naphthoyl-CoA hydrolase